MSNATAAAELQQQLEQLEQLISLVRDSKVVVSATVASLALLLYDYFLTLGQEVDLVWKRKFGWGKVLFFVVRYFGIFAHTWNTAVYIQNTGSVSFCRAAIRFQTGTSTAVLFLVELTLVIRVWLLYNRSWKILLLLGFFYICSLITVTVMSVVALLHQSILVRPGPFLSGCYGAIPSYFYNILIPPAINTSVLLALTAYRTISTMKLSSGAQQPRMVVLLLRDGIIYFVLVFGVLVINILAFHLAKAGLTQVASGFFVAVPCMVGARIFLNVREQLLEPTNLTEMTTLGYEMGGYRRNGYGVELETDIQFASVPDGARMSPISRISLEPTSATELVPKANGIHTGEKEERKFYTEV